MSSQQKDAPSLPDYSNQVEIVEGQTSISSQEEEIQPVRTHTEAQLSEGIKPATGESDTSNISPEEPFSDSDFHLYLPASMECCTQEQQTVIPTQKESVPEDSPVINFVSQDVSPQKKTKEKRKLSPEPEQPLRRVTRRQLKLDELSESEPYGKKLRSSSSPSSSPQPLRRIKPTIRSFFRRVTTAGQPPSKTAKGKSSPVVQEGDVSVAKSDVSGHESAAAVQESEATVQESEAAVQESEATVLENEVEMDTGETVVQETQQEEIGASNVQATAEAGWKHFSQHVVPNTLKNLKVPVY